MSGTEDEAQDLDSGWDTDDDSDAEAAEAPSGVEAVASSEEPATEEVDSGWDDVPEAAPGAAPQPGGKRRPHRVRRAKTNAVPVSSSPVLSPRPAEPTKKQQREH